MQNLLNDPRIYSTLILDICSLNEWDTLILHFFQIVLMIIKQCFFMFEWSEHSCTRADHAWFLYGSYVYPIYIVPNTPLVSRSWLQSIVYVLMICFLWLRPVSGMTSASDSKTFPFPFFSNQILKKYGGLKIRMGRQTFSYDVETCKNQ